MSFLKAIAFFLPEVLYQTSSFCNKRQNSLHFFLCCHLFRFKKDRAFSIIVAGIVLFFSFTTLPNSCKFTGNIVLQVLCFKDAFPLPSMPDIFTNTSNLASFECHRLQGFLLQLQSHDKCKASANPGRVACCSVSEFQHLYLLSVHCGLMLSRILSLTEAWCLIFPKYNNKRPMLDKWPYPLASACIFLFSLCLLWPTR